MKRLFLLLTLCGMAAVGCTEGGVDDTIDNGGNNTEQPDNGGNEDESDIPENIFFGLDKESATLSPDGGSVDVTVYSNYKWEISGTSDWCTPSITKGDANEDGQKVTFSADVAYDNREATFWFRCADEKIKVVVSQKLKESIIPDENNTFEISAEGGIAVINYQTNVECEVIIPEEAKSWISLAPETRGLESGCATLNIAKSNAGADRRAVVKVVKMGDQSVFAEYTITQERNMDYIILYTTTNGETIRPNSFDYLTNTYEDGVGMLAFDGSKVTLIGSSAFSGCDLLASVTIPDSVTSIGDYAFSDCTSLTSVTIPDSVTSIGDQAFRDCSRLTSVTIGNGVTSIGEVAFLGCFSLTSVYITDIAAWCNISFVDSASNPLGYAENLYLNNELVIDLIIPDSVTSIGSGLFSNCTSLTSVTIPDNVTSIGDDAFSGCTSLTSVTIPDSVTSIGYMAFTGCTSLTSVTIGNGVTSIGDYAFYSCYSLTSVTIPDSITSIGGGAFCWCTSLTSITIPDSVTSIGDKAFCNCDSLTSVTIPNSVTSIGNSAFCWCTSLTNVTIGNGVTEIGDEAFCNCDSLTSITIPDSVTSIGNSAFCLCDSLKSVTIGKGVTSIGEDAFSGCTGELIVNCNIPSASTYECGAFYGSEFTRVTIGDSVTSIGYYAFSGCNSLTSVTIGNGVTKIRYCAFYSCNSLKEVYCKPTTPPTGESSMFTSNASGRKIYVPRNSVSAYKSASRWSDYASAIVGYDF